MNCTEVLSLVSPYLTGELDAARAAELTQHLRDCAPCAAETGRQAALDAQVRASIAAEPIDSTALERRVRQVIASESRAPAGALRWLFAAAACVVALVLGFASYRLMHPVAAPPTMAAAARDHDAEIVDRQPRRWQTERASIEKLAAQQGVPVSVMVAFTKDGFRLEQGKLCRLDNLTYLHLVYTSGEQRFSLFLRQEPGASTHDSIDKADLGADHVAAFHDGPLSAIVVTDQPGDAASHLARFAAAALERS